MRLATFLALSLFAGPPPAAVGTGPAEKELLALHAAVLKAHLDSNVKAWLATESDDYVVANRGEITHPTMADREKRLGEYLGRTRFHEYRDLVPPVIRVSRDGSLGWVIAQVTASGIQRTEDGTERPIEFVSAWIELYEKQGNRWVRTGNVSNFKEPAAPRPPNPEPAATRLRLIFEPATASDKAAAAEYQAIWAAEGDRIVRAMESRAGLPFEERVVRVIVVEGMSRSGFESIPMRLRSSYPPNTKKGTLVHELGHRLEGRFFKKDDEDHPYLFLWLYDVWVDLYGKAFADDQVRIESQRRGHYDYEKAWKEALAMTPEQRAAKWKEFLRSRPSS